MHETIQDVALHETTRSRYLNYALSVITSRALPDVRDGLKPVQRRILYAMYTNLRLGADAKHRKSAAVVGEVMAKYHPHGDQSIYDAMVRMAQGFSLRYPLVDGQGNFGSLDGDSAAAMRYTEARLRHIAEELSSELKKQTVDFRLNYDGTLFEPVALPAQFPNLLVNGATGIAVGMATNIPPHNLKEVIDALVAMIDDPDIDLERIVGPIIKGPDFPTGGAILTSREEMLEVYREGHGSIEIRADYHLEFEGHRRRIAITSIPYSVNKASLVSSIAELIRLEKVPHLVDIRDESTDNIRVVLELKRGADPDAAMSYMFKRTALLSRFSVNLTALVPTDDPQICQPKRLNLREMLKAFLSFRHGVTRRRLEYDLDRLQRRIHILRAFAIVFGGLDVAIALIRTSENKVDARERLMDRFGLDWEQAEAILETKLYRLAKLEIDAIRQELQEKEVSAEEIRQTLSSEARMWSLIRSELVSIADAYGDRRRSHITGPIEMAEFSEEEYIVEEDAFIMVSREGRIKRQKSYTELSSVRVREGDELGWLMPASTRDTVILFTDRGRAYTMRVADIPQTTGYGDPIQTRFDFGDGEHVVGVTASDERCLPAVPPEVLELLEPEDPQPPYALAISRGGKAVRFSLDTYREPSTVSGRRFMRLDDSFENDGVVAVRMSDSMEWISLATRQGHCLIFSVNEINVLSGPGKGVMAVKLKPDDYVLGFELTTDAMGGLTVVTNRGRIEVVRPNKYKVTKRGGRGREIIRRGYLAKVRSRPIEIELEKPEPEQSEEIPGENGESEGKVESDSSPDPNDEDFQVWLFDSDDEVDSSS